ncbi:VOC family protein [Arthrobacter sp. KK5.5]|uniref:VOC family protein n=1 Tax=Arthrobacter sp. KK5.5 TaxID=3373084 RepID=UPI003EE4AA36
MSTSKLTAILPVQDMERAKAFYRDTLGLEPTAELDDGSQLFSSDGSTAIELMLRPDVVPTDVTALSFQVDDLPGAIGNLEGAGVVFRDYDEPGLKTEDHIVTTPHHKTAWFADTEGNLLCLHQPL